MNDNQLNRILEEALSNKSSNSEKISDKVNVACTLFISNTLESLSGQIKQLKKEIENLDRSNNFHGKWMRGLTIALIVTTLLVGVLNLL